jgi:hypothetical protein
VTLYELLAKAAKFLDTTVPTCQGSKVQHQGEWNDRGHEDTSSTCVCIQTQQADATHYITLV